MPILTCNAIPVLVDADPVTGNLDPGDLERHLTPRTVAVVVTHNAGIPVDMKPVQAFARKHRIKLVEDCSHAHGAMCDGRKVGTFGDVAAFSLQSKKLVPAGEGGVLITSVREIYERANLLGHARERTLQQVKNERYRPFASTGFGLNYRIHPFGAALAIGQFDRLEENIQARENSLGYLSRQLESVGGIQPPILQKHVTRPVYYSYRPLYRPEETEDLPIEVFVEAIRSEGVPLDRPKAPPLHYEAIFQVEDAGMKTYSPIGGKRRLYSPGDFPNCEHYVSRVLRMPSCQQPMEEYFDQIAEAIKKVVAQLGALHDLARSRHTSS